MKYTKHLLALFVFIFVGCSTAKIDRLTYELQVCKQELAAKTAESIFLKNQVEEKGDELFKVQSQFNEYRAKYNNVETAYRLGLKEGIISMYKSIAISCWPSSERGLNTYYIEFWINGNKFHSHKIYTLNQEKTHKSMLGSIADVATILSLFF